MKYTVENIINRHPCNLACTYIINFMGEDEIYTRETKDKLIRHWGLEEAFAYFLTTGELVINII